MEENCVDHREQRPPNWREAPKFFLFWTSFTHSCWLVSSLASVYSLTPFSSSTLWLCFCVFFLLRRRKGPVSRLGINRGPYRIWPTVGYLFGPLCTFQVHTHWRPSFLPEDHVCSCYKMNLSLLICLLVFSCPPPSLRRKENVSGTC